VIWDDGRSERFGGYNRQHALNPPKTGLERDRQDGSLKPGGTIVEGTAGNTGIGLALVGASLGYKTVIVIPETQSQEKKDMLRLAGAELVQVPAKPYRSPNNYVKYSERLAKALNEVVPEGAIWANQFDNTANRQMHVNTTAAEIFEQTDGGVDGFICAVGSGGTLAGVAEGLRARKPGVKIGLADPMGAALHSFYTTGTLQSEGNSITEGIGQGRITANLDGLSVDHSYQVDDTQAVHLAGSTSAVRSKWPRTWDPVTRL